MNQETNEIPHAEPGQEMGTQPLDALLTDSEVSSAQLIEAMKGNLTYKAVNRARHGRRITRKMQLNILTAMRSCLPDRNLSMADVFNYKG